MTPTKPTDQLPLNHPTTTISYSTTLPTAHLPLPTSYEMPTKTGLDPIHTPTSAPPTTPAYQATGHNNSLASTSPSPVTTTSTSASVLYNPTTPTPTLPLLHTIHPSWLPLLHYPIHKLLTHYVYTPRLDVSRFTSYLIN